MTDLPTRPPSPRRARTVPAKHIEEECRLLETTLRRQRLATPEELAAYRPGGPSNPARDAFGWYTYAKRLHRLHARQESAIVGPSAANAGHEHSQVDDELLERAQNEQPVRVDLHHPVCGVEYVLVHPLSGHALTHLDARDDIMNCAAMHATHLQRSSRLMDRDLRRELMEEIAYQRALCLWIVTSDQAPELPFSARTDPRPTEPELYRHLHTTDSVRIFAGHHRINGQALTILRRWVSVETASEGKVGRAGSWRTFTAVLEADSNHQVPSQRFWHNRALVSLMANRALAAREAERIHAEAKAKADAEATAKTRR